MKRFFLMTILMLSIFVLTAQVITTGSGTNSVTVLSSSGSETVLHYQIGKFEQTPVDISGQEWFHVTLPKEGITQEKGFPQLPVFNRSIIIDDSSLMRLEVFDLKYQDYQIPVAPSKGVLTRDINPSTVLYSFDETYEKDEFWPRDLAQLSQPYILRDYRGIVVQTNPFAYNPVSQTLRVYTSFKVRVYSSGTDTVNTITRSRDSISRDFVSIYENQFLNWDSHRYTPVDDSFGKLLVICHSSFMNAIQPYVNWKIQKGIETELVEWSSIGSTAAQLQTYIQNRYNADNSLTFVQIVGDAPQIPSLSSGGGGADPMFSLVRGNDNYPDIFIGRFSAETTAQVTAQINKVIASERDFTTSDTWLRGATGIASNEGGAGADNNETDIQHMNIIRNKLLNYGYTTVDQIYDPGASASTVTSNVNAGRGVINYVGHGSNTSWGTTGFNNTNASNLSNGTKAPVIMDVACINGNFVSITCFAEAWQRNANGGSVAMYASSINQSWASPMRAQDEFTDLLIANSKTTVGGLYYNSSCAMMDVYGTDGVNMFKTWHIFGDASMLMRTQTPLAMNVTHPATIMMGGTSLSVNTGVANALVAVTYNNIIYGRAVTNSAGTATITLSNPPSGILSYTITATAFDRVTYVGTINQIAASGPYISVSNVVYADSNNNQPEYDEAGRFNVTFKNEGTSTASNVTAILSTSTAGISITDNSETITSLVAGASVTRNDAFAFNIANNVVDGTIAQFTITMSAGSETWEHQFVLELNVPVLEFGDMNITEISGNGNGIFDPGETINVSIILKNTGDAASQAGTATLSCSTSRITIVENSDSFTAISSNGEKTLNFRVSANSSVPQGTLAALNFSATAGQYSAAVIKEVEIGAPLEVVIGTGTSSQTYPLDRYYNYSTHEAIYLASEIGSPATIKSMAYQKASGTDTNPIEAVTVYMKNTTDSSLSSGNYSLSGYTQVYSGNWPNNATSGWMEIDLDDMFLYGGANLSILVLKDYQYWTSYYPNWTYTTSSQNRARQNRSDSSQPTSLTATTSLPNLRLKLFPAAEILLPPQNLTAEASHRSVKLDWEAPATGTPSGYKIYRNNFALTTVTNLSYTDTAVTNGSTYSYKITALYDGEESEASNTVSATPNIYAPTNLTADGGNGVVMLSWNATQGREADETPELGEKSRAISSYRIYRDGSALTTVTGTSYNDTDVSNGTTYSYHVTTIYSNPAGESDPSNTATATPNQITEAIIGSGTSSTSAYSACPINVYYQSLHGQSVYTKTELNAAGVVGPTMITKIGFNVTGTPNNAMPNYIIRMGHTSAINGETWIPASAVSTVWTASSYQPSSTGWNMLTLSTPFEWNGVDNIVVDTAFGRIGSYSSTGTVQYTSMNSGYRYTQSDYSDQTNLFSGGNISNNRPNLKLVLQPIATGPAIAAEPESISKTVYEGSSDTASLAIRNTGTEALNWSAPSSFAAWGSVSPTSGTIQPEGSSELTLYLNAGALALGNYNANLVITSNAENHPNLSVPITMTVKPEPEPIRFVAEWEQAQGAVIAYSSGFGLPMSLISDLSNSGELYVLVTSSTQNTARNQLQSGGVNMSNVEFVVRNGVNTYWTRDYAPWTIFDASGQMAFVDFNYNRPRPYDNAVPAALASYFGIDYSYMPLTTTGGNTMTDGNGKMMSTSLVQSENSSYTLTQIEDIVKEYLGVDEYITYADPLINSTIDHIDCHAKILDVDKVMVARVPSNHQNYNNLESVANLFANKLSSYGTPYKVYRVNQSSNNEPYANSFIFNDKIYVPQWNSTASSYDTAAIAAYQAAMPGYTVQGYYNSSWLSDDALHCRVNTIHDSQLVHVWHQPHTSAMANSSIVVDVQITHHNPLNPANTYVAYRHGATGQWQYVTLTHVSGKQWTASIPTPALGQTLYYYILATDNTSRSALMPLCGANDPFALLINIPAANNAPTIDLPVYFEFDMNGSLVVDFAQHVQDEDGDELTLSYSGNTNVNVAINGLTVTFTATENWHGTEELTFTVSDGTDDASDTVEVRVKLNWLATPGISITYVDAANDYVKVEWNAVPNANFYQVWASDNPYDGYSFLGETTDTHFNDMNLGLARRFYKVYASDVSMLTAAKN